MFSERLITHEKVDTFIGQWTGVRVSCSSSSSFYLYVISPPLWTSPTAFQHDWIVAVKSKKNRERERERVNAIMTFIQWLIIVFMVDTSKFVCNNNYSVTMQGETVTATPLQWVRNVTRPHQSFLSLCWQHYFSPLEKYTGNGWTFIGDHVHQSIFTSSSTETNYQSIKSLWQENLSLEKWKLNWYVSFLVQRFCHSIVLWQEKPSKAFSRTDCSHNWC